MQDQKIGQLLLQDGVINESQLQQALTQQKESYGKPLGEIMISLHLIEETDFLRVLAKQFHTQYLTAKKLSELQVTDAVLKMVPQNTAEKHNLFPVQYKRGDKTLTVVTTNPDNVSAVDEVKFVSGIGNVKCLVGLAEPIKAAINHWYKGDNHAFDHLLGMGADSSDYGMANMGAGAAPPPANQLEKDDSPLDLSALLETEESRGASKPPPKPREGRAKPVSADDRDVLLAGATEEVYLGGMGDMPGDDNMARDQIVIEDVNQDEQIEVEEVTLTPMAKSGAAKPGPAEEEIEAKPTRRADVKKYRMRMLVVEPHESIRKFIIKLFSHEGFKVRGCLNREEVLAELGREPYDTLVIKDRDLGEGEEFVNLMSEKFPDVEICSIKDYGSAVIGETRAQKRLMSSFLETLDILMGLLEMESKGLKGHSHNTAKYARLIAGKLDLPQREVDTIALAAYVHELGKQGIPHRSVLSATESADLDALMEQVQIPLKILSSAKYPLDIGPILKHQYERWDGRGVPDKLPGEEIPIGARVLALVEAFEHLTNKSIGEAAMEPTAALEALKKEAKSSFDPALVDLLLGVVRDDIYLQQMSVGQDKVLIVDTELDLVTLLELRLVNMGFACSAARSGQEGLDKIKSEKPSLVLAEVELPDFSGLDMIEKMKADPELKDIPFIILSRKDDSNTINRGYRLGAEDFITKPIKVEILGVKLNNIMQKLKAEKKTAPAAAGVSGSLKEMGLPDIVQILGAGRKTGRITLENNGRNCTIDMEDGQVVNAAVDDLKGEDAFYKILFWNEGSFSINPTVAITERLIHLSNDSLMLEGFRRMDEASHGEAAKEDISLDGSDFF